MNEKELTRIHRKMKRAFDEETLNGFGYVTGFLKRKRKLKDVRAKLKGKRADLVVRWSRYGDGFEPRIILVWNPAFRRHMYLFTNLEVDEFSLPFVRELYSLRWRVEVLDIFGCEAHEVTGDSVDGHAVGACEEDLHPNRISRH